MELRAIIEIFKKHKNIFWRTLLVFVFLGFISFYFQPKTYTSTLMLNVTRSGLQETSDYQYDDFYRLQADERFADTVARWIDSPIIYQNIYEDAKIEFRKPIKATRLSSQVIEVTFKTKNREDGIALSSSAEKILNRQIEELNKFQKNKNWFMLVASEPVIAEGGISLPVSLLGSFAIGLFFSFWSVMIKNYLGNEKR
ncbi:MAG: hypothetical protein ACD_11C00021G0016 [uncultured bacterium]|nr:MAG: hypothetical protein ACD_11C00021G0016 [uncultured bacterium]HBR71816.1 hypothetical protein [Candidatus Moranbacteria bacterium]